MKKLTAVTDPSTPPAPSHEPETSPEPVAKPKPKAKPRYKKVDGEWVEVTESVDIWVKAAKQTVNESEKISLATHVISHLFDYINNPDWNDVVISVNDSIRSSKINEEFSGKEFTRNINVIEEERYMIATYFLLESDITWADVNLKPVHVVDDLYRLERRINNGNRIVLSE